MCENCNEEQELQEDSIKRINAVKFLRENGLFFQINRDILHPLGLAMQADLCDDGSGDGAIVDLWDCRDDVEGIVYDEETMLRGEAKLKKFMDEFGNAKHAERFQTLGFLTQYAKTYGEGDFLENAVFGFGRALDAVKAGLKIYRKGWDAAGLFVVYQKAYPNGIPINKNTAEATGLPEGTVCQFLPYLMLKTKDDQFVPWTPNTIDVLAEDWTYKF